MNKEQRNDLIDQYVGRIVDGMDWKDLAQIAGEALVSNLKSYTDDELVGEIADYYPDLLQDDSLDLTVGDTDAD
jgi:hypothetical protein